MKTLEQGECLESSDADYVASSRNGHPEDFRVLVQRYQRPLFAYLTGQVKDPLEAEEAAQESFVRAFTSLEKLRKPESFFAWLMGIAGRVLKEHYRARERRQKQEPLAEELLVESPVPPSDYPLEEALAGLPESYRQVILLRYYEGQSCQQIKLKSGRVK